MNIAELFEAMSCDAEYVPHKAFKGVYLKHLIKGEETDGRISCHLVKVEPFCSLEEHTHPEQIEIHEVIFGAAECRIAAGEFTYRPGVIKAIPQDVPHSVTAGKDGVYILAKFTPALL